MKTSSPAPRPRRSKRTKRERPKLDMKNPPHGLRPEEAAELLGLSASSYYRHVRPAVLRGEILSVRIGRNVCILTASLLAWFEAQAREQRDAWRETQAQRRGKQS